MSFTFCNLCACFLRQWADRGICHYPFWSIDASRLSKKELAMSVIIEGDTDCPHYRNEAEFIAELKTHNWYSSTYPKKEKEVYERL